MVLTLKNRMRTLTTTSHTEPCVFEEQFLRPLSPLDHLHSDVYKPACIHLHQQPVLSRFRQSSLT
ncbi:hypothetical protein Hanom_Chr11g01029031 [Helianthus anomalus]